MDRDGGLITIEQTGTGDVVSKAFNSAGVLTAVEWQESNGDFLIKTYFDDGTAKGLSVGNGADVRFTLIQTEYGKPTYREFILDDGEKLVAKYDVAGNPSEEWHV